MQYVVFSCCCRPSLERWTARIRLSDTQKLQVRHLPGATLSNRSHWLYCDAPIVVKFSSSVRIRVRSALLSLQPNAAQFFSWFALSRYRVTEGAAYTYNSPRSKFRNRLSRIAICALAEAEAIATAVAVAVAVAEAPHVAQP